MPANSPGGRVTPDVPYLHRELRRKGVTLQLLWEAMPRAPLPGWTPQGAASRTQQRGLRHRHASLAATPAIK